MGNLRFYEREELRHAPLTSARMDRNESGGDVNGHHATKRCTVPFKQNVGEYVVSAVPDIELPTVDYELFIGNNHDTLTALGQQFSQFANLVMHVDNFQPEVVDPLHLTVQALSDPNINAAASETGGLNEETGQFDLPAVEIYNEIEQLISNITPRPITLPSEIWTTHDGELVTTTFAEALNLLGTELTYGADNPTIPENLVRWLFDAQLDVGTAVLKTDKFITLQSAIELLDTYISHAVDSIGHAKYLSQWSIEVPNAESEEGVAIYKLLQLLKQDLDRAKGFWIEFLTVTGEVVRGMRDVYEALWSQGFVVLGV
ncbi:hypothetical protein TWF730_008016 [Orbilia blumenaviensis]|uniref:Uncharacterized protein n=1 Tax=Orbilia blumenaviensis TaxID=1796055 RepID=A0AAV9VC88_9PEZI